VNTDPTSLDRLHDIVVPPPSPWWPPAPAWYWILGTVLALLLVLLVRSFLHWQRNRYRREALAELARQEKALRDPNQRAATLATLAELLKRAALSAWPREGVASLTGSAWQDFLDRTAATTAFATGPGAVLERAVYDPRVADELSEDQLQEIITTVRYWLKNHRTPREL
jgi:hypothetical protein